MGVLKYEGWNGFWRITVGDSDFGLNSEKNNLFFLAQPNYTVGVFPNCLLALFVPRPLSPV